MALVSREEKVGKFDICPRFSTPVVFKAFWSQNEATCVKAKTFIENADDCPVSTPKTMSLGLLNFKK